MTLDNPSAIADYLKSLRTKRQEHFGIICVDSQLNVICKKILFIGSDNSSLVSPRIVFWYACQKNAHAIFLFHNHPSNCNKPSREDEEITKHLCIAGKYIGIEVLDHVIISKKGYFSFKEHDMLEDSERSERLVAN